MDVTTLGALGSLLVGVGGLAAAVVTFLGKHGENAITGYNSLTDQLQEELTRKTSELAEKSAALAVEAAERARAEAEIARLRAENIRLGGQP